MKFIGGPFMPGCHEAIREYLESVHGPFPPPQPEELTASDLDRCLPRHFPLSIPSDPVPGFPVQRASKRRRS
jgi:hypothetical protein